MIKNAITRQSGTPTATQTIAPMVSGGMFEDVDFVSDSNVGW